VPCVHEALGELCARVVPGRALAAVVKSPCGSAQAELSHAIRAADAVQATPIRSCAGRAKHAMYDILSGYSL
jgi:hypothetical protein